MQTSSTKKIEVSICMGTTCYLLSNSEMQELESELSPLIAPYVQIRGAACLGTCKETAYRRVPCANVNGTLIENAEKNKLVRIIEKEVRSSLRIGGLNGK